MAMRVPILMPLTSPKKEDSQYATADVVEHLASTNGDPVLFGDFFHECFICFRGKIRAHDQRDAECTT